MLRGLPQTLGEAWALLWAQAETIATLEAENTALRMELAALRAEVDRLRAQVQELTARLGQNSSNSSKPPSSDPPHHPPRPARPASGRTPGGQPGHRGHGRMLLPPDQVDRVVELRPVACVRCGALLLGESLHPERHQVTDLPVVRPEVVEYQRHTLTCLACGALTEGEWPTAMPPGAFGPRARATVGYLTGRLGLSQRESVEALETLYNTPIGLGSLPAQERAVSVALAQPVADAHQAAREQPVQHVDETSWREGTRRCWLWVCATGVVTVFLVLATRGARGAKQLLGETPSGIVESDRWSGYRWLDPTRRQVCWAHLKRDFQALVDRGGESVRLGRALLEQTQHLFRLWHEVRTGALSRAELPAAMEPVRRAVGSLLREGVGLRHPTTRRTCRNLLQLEGALWTFVQVEGVEPTNNAAERPLRRAVLWRRRSFGTQSPAGSRFVERVLTAVTTLRQQRRDVMDYLTAACAAAISGEKPPSLLPTPSTPIATM
jgi:transposase